ncbi:hypothetical protein CGGC5_v008889 [Colletotrichum fructicola Nara gc5]|uniref:Uncharacterized protein n=1 Tax=Colletotrichum fructicola (strain Nara gc5) TaxID=1213859 RepID=A0A7J6IZC3_COLFN|nr:hypothetical protein CGGC5_v008889 [Colletotrichum fructicola Nara gc5]
MPKFSCQTPPHLLAIYTASRAPSSLNHEHCLEAPALPPGPLPRPCGAKKFTELVRGTSPFVEPVGLHAQHSGNKKGHHHTEQRETSR